ncbi:MAG: alpha/beta hydrolase [Microcoleaceae cyanobacterium]
MFPSLLPSLAEQLTESTSIQLAQNLQLQGITTHLKDSPLQTTYVHQGNGGIPILLLHGFDSSVFEFRRLLPLLAHQNQIFAVDLLGFGLTERDTNIAINPQNITTHLYSFWKALINQPCIVVGASMGGAAAIDFTLSYPELVKYLVLIDSAGISRGPIIGKFLFSPFDRWATNFLSNPKVRQGISQNAYFNKQFASEDARICAALHLEHPNWSQALISFTKSGGYGSYKNQLKKIKQNTLIIWGENDKILGTKDAANFQQLIANSQLKWIPNCGHVPHLEQPQLTAQAILGFIS